MMFALLCAYPGYVVVRYVRSHVNRPCVVQESFLKLQIVEFKKTF